MTSDKALAKFIEIAVGEFYYTPKEVAAFTPDVYDRLRSMEDTSEEAVRTLAYEWL